MLEAPGATGGDHRDVHHVGDCPRELDVVAVLRAVAIHAGEQDLARPALRPLAGPFDRVLAGPDPAAVEVQLDEAATEDDPTKGLLITIPTRVFSEAADSAPGEPMKLRVNVEKGTLVADSDNTLTLSISASSPLSLPWSLDTFLPQLATAADKVTAAVK